MALVIVLALAAALLAGCGSEAAEPTAPEPTPEAETADAAATPAPERRRRPRGTRIRTIDSPFGTILGDRRGQAVYLFDKERSGESECYGECARAWPPVFANGKPRAAKGVRKSLLGTVRRRNGRRQVTYAGKPLYYYAHEGPGEVRCHNVNLNGGFWWVLAPDGRRRP
jgi:predicted lipoprotein with Yx(FWY)xxD motif